ncbi:MAG TPA: hypothetical protein VLG46_11575, partial [Anaerolineae bacterium]|nr:hypothetical protein [Anaerolineae bacterium]
MMRTRTLAVLVGGFLAVLVFMAAVFAPQAQARTTLGAPWGQAVIAAPPQYPNQTGGLAPAAGVTCTLEVTQTVGAQGN